MSIDDQATEAIITKTYHYLLASQLANFTDVSKLDICSFDTPQTNYVPVFQPGAEKLRSITAKESNYFNIL
jgi:hypothetical protein